MKNIKLTFKGYWRAEKSEFIPEKAGVYLVYKCTYYPSSDTVSLSDLIYIGKSNNVNRRVQEHLQANDLIESIQSGETLCFSFAEVPEGELELVENALIFAQQPKYNHKGKESYLYEDAGFSIEGRCSLLRYTSFTITSPL